MGGRFPKVPGVGLPERGRGDKVENGRGGESPEGERGLRLDGDAVDGSSREER